MVHLLTEKGGTLGLHCSVRPFRDRVLGIMHREWSEMGGDGNVECTHKYIFVINFS